MASVLERQLARAVYAGFKGRLLKGRLIRMVGDSLDAAGDLQGAVPTPYALQGFTDQYSAFIKAKAGIPDTDVKVCVFGASLPPGIKPMQDDKVVLVRYGRDEWYQLRATPTDPAEALWECQAFSIPAPEAEGGGGGAGPCP